MIRVKICGITSPEDADAALDAGADALGFNGWSGSKRHIDLAAAAPWIADLPPFAFRVAVLVNPALDELRRLVDTGAFDALQLHGDESPEFCRAAAALGRPIIRALRCARPEDLDRATEPRIPWILVDASADGAYGGSGTPGNLAVGEAFARRLPGRHLIWAGGLTPENVAATVARIRPAAVDVASGVECRGQPRKKDPARLRAFIHAARGALSP
jgi:phosphoribosylanthranilate isomerase